MTQQQKENLTVAKRGKKKARAARRNNRSKNRPAFDVLEQSAAIQLVEQAKEAWAERRFDDSLDLFATALNEDPQNAVLLVDTAKAFALRFRLTEAESCLQRAFDLHADDAFVLVLLGRTFASLNRLESAIDCLGKALSIGLTPVERAATLYELATIQERLHRLAEARQAADAAMQIIPKEPLIQYLLGLIDRREGHFERAQTRLESLAKHEAVPNQVRADANYQLSLINDKLDRPAIAFQAAERAKQTLHPLARGYRRQADEIAVVSDQTMQSVSQQHFSRWGTCLEALEQLPGRFAMLVGYPRSGTTLIEQVLDTHPELESADELAVFSELVYYEMHQRESKEVSDTRMLDALEHFQIEQLRTTYWKAMSGVLSQSLEGRMLLDKNPGLTGLLPVVARVFPEARILFALRDPRDVVISCFLQQLPLNPLSVNFLSLHQTVKHYVQTMEFWTKIRPLLQNPWLEVRYEETVRDLPGQARRVLEFLDLPWTDAVLNYRQQASVKNIHSPSYEAVTQPLYDSSIGRWRRYAKHLAPYLEPLQPFVKEFGYED